KTALFRFNIEKCVLNYDSFLAVFSPSTYLYTPIGRRKRRLHLNATAPAKFALRRAELTCGQLNLLRKLNSLRELYGKINSAEAVRLQFSYERSEQFSCERKRAI
ncbi:MAG: hypothetical protein K6F09_08725, partial [Clostridiales bacterium]|nr:hypothetical protein [Clostridiales bacterium]